MVAESTVVEPPMAEATPEPKAEEEKAEKFTFFPVKKAKKDADK